VERESLQPELGARLRLLRQERRLTLSEVANATGISASFLSLVESGKNDLTISRLARLCSYYRLGVEDVLHSLAPPDALVLRRGEQRQFFSPAEGIGLSMLGPPGATRMRPFSIRFEPAGHYAEPITSAAELFLAVVEGRLEMSIDDLDPVVLEAGDSVYLPPGRRHVYRNPDPAQPATALAVISPPRAGPGDLSSRSD